MSVTGPQITGIVKALVGPAFLQTGTAAARRTAAGATDLGATLFTAADAAAARAALELDARYPRLGADNEYAGVQTVTDGATGTVTVGPGQIVVESVGEEPSQTVLTTSSVSSGQFVGSGSALTGLTTGQIAGLAAALDGKQPLDAGLTALAALDTAALARLAAATADRRGTAPRTLRTEVLCAFRAGYGGTSYLADGYGASTGATLTAGSAPALVPGGSPGGWDYLTLDGSQTFGVTLSGANRSGLVLVLVSRPTGDGTLVEDTDGWRMRIAVSGTNMQSGQLGGEATGFAASRQFSTFVLWHSGAASVGAQGYCNRRSAGAAAPGADTNVPGLSIKGSQDFVALYVLRMLTTTDLPATPTLYDLHAGLFDATLPSGPKSWACVGDSNTAGVSGMAYSQTFVGQVAAGLPPGWKVGSAAVPGTTDGELLVMAPLQVDHRGAKVVSCTSLTNTVAFGGAGSTMLTASQAQAVFLQNLRARCGASPDTLFLFSDCPPRSDMAGNQTAYDTAQATLNGTSGLRAGGLFDTLASNTGIARPGAGLPSNCRLVRVSTLSLTRPDNVHPDAAGNVLLAALFLAAAADGGAV